MAAAKVLAKLWAVGKYALASFTGYQIHDQFVGPNKELVPYVERHIIEKKDDNDELDIKILLYVILAVMLFFILLMCDFESMFGDAKQRKRKIPKFIGSLTSTS